MGCNCKDNRENINQGLEYFQELKQLFIKRMTEDSETQDRRKRDFNQAIFHYYDEDDIRRNEEYRDKFGFVSPIVSGDTYPVWDEITMDMVLECFDAAVKDWRKSWCDVNGCMRK